jgi:hypothetical protein
MFISPEYPTTEFAAPIDLHEKGSMDVSLVVPSDDPQPFHPSPIPLRGSLDICLALPFDSLLYPLQDLLLMGAIYDVQEGFE